MENESKILKKGNKKSFNKLKREIKLLKELNKKRGIKNLP